MSQEVDEAVVTKVDEAETDGTGNFFKVKLQNIHYIIK